MKFLRMCVGVFPFKSSSFYTCGMTMRGPHKSMPLPNASFREQAVIYQNKGTIPSLNSTIQSYKNIDQTFFCTRFKFAMTHESFNGIHL